MRSVSERKASAMNLVILLAAGLILAILEHLPQLSFRRAAFFRSHFGSDLIYLLTGYVAVASLSLAYVIGASNLIGSTLGVPRFAALNLPLWISAPLALV